MSEKQCMEYLADINTPVLSSEMKDLCDNYITLNEIFTALNAMSSNKHQAMMVSQKNSTLHFWRY